MIVHQAIGMAEPVTREKSIEKKLPVGVVAKDWLLFVAARG
jgi:hypothetical protein